MLCIPKLKLLESLLQDLFKFNLCFRYDGIFLRAIGTESLNLGFHSAKCLQGCLVTSELAFHYLKWK